jgi:hypothetical protein
MLIGNGAQKYGAKIKPAPVAGFNKPEQLIGELKINCFGLQRIQFTLVIVPNRS